MNRPQEGGLPTAGWQERAAQLWRGTFRCVWHRPEQPGDVCRRELVPVLALHRAGGQGSSSCREGGAGQQADRLQAASAGQALGGVAISEWCFLAGQLCLFQERTLEPRCLARPRMWVRPSLCLRRAC